MKKNTYIFHLCVECVCAWFSRWPWQTGRRPRRVCNNFPPHPSIYPTIVWSKSTCSSGKSKQTMRIFVWDVRTIILCSSLSLLITFMNGNPWGSKHPYRRRSSFRYHQTSLILIYWNGLTHLSRFIKMRLQLNTMHVDVFGVNCSVKEPISIWLFCTHTFHTFLSDHII